MPTPSEFPHTLRHSFFQSSSSICTTCHVQGLCETRAAFSLHPAWGRCLAKLCSGRAWEEPTLAALSWPVLTVLCWAEGPPELSQCFFLLMTEEMIRDTCSTSSLNMTTELHRLAGDTDHFRVTSVLPMWLDNFFGLVILSHYYTLHLR